MASIPNCADEIVLSTQMPAERVPPWQLVGMHPSRRLENAANQTSLHAEAVFQKRIDQPELVDPFWISMITQDLFANTIDRTRTNLVDIDAVKPKLVPSCSPETFSVALELRTPS